MHSIRSQWARVASVGFVAVVIVLSGGPSALQAQDAPPISRDCDAEIPAGEYNDRLDCKTENVNAALFEYVDAAIEFDRVGRAMGREPVFSDSQIEHLLAGRDRAQSAKNRTHQAQMFRGAVKKQKSEEEDCYVKEIIGDMGGPKGGDDVQPCEMGEDCEEVVGDDVGDDDGVCRLKGANREVCVQVCQQPLSTDEDTYDPAVASEAEQGLDELEVALTDATGEVKKATSRLQAAYSPDPDVSDCEMYEFGLFPGAFALQAAQATKNVTGATFNSCSVLCNQDAFGWNCQAACLVFAIVDGIANIVNDAFSVIDDNNGTAQLDRVARCTTHLEDRIQAISTSVGGTQASLDEVNAQLEDLGAQLAVVNAQLETLAQTMATRLDHVDTQLCTPQGQRECFPGGPPVSGGAPTASTPKLATAGAKSPSE